MAKPGELIIRCAICGERLAPAGDECRICLEPRARRRRLRASWPRRGVTYVLLPLLFLGSCTALLPVGMRIADPMTHVRVDLLDRPFPVLVMTGGVPRVQRVRDLRRVPVLPSGSSYLIPAGQDDVIQTQLNEDLPPHAEGGWVLRVRRLTPQRQHIELYWMNDGYSGGAYEATASSFFPRYRKMTGPGFAFVFGGIAFLLNLLIWSVLILAVRWWRR